MNNPIKAVKRRISYHNSPDRKYRDYWYSCPVNKNYIMLEPGRGETVSGNMFAILKELCTAPEWESYQVFFVVTNKTTEEAQTKIKKYGFEKVKLVMRMSDEYLKLLASCKFFFSDNTYPDIFCKKPDQVLANTWHGTPLKKMGRANIGGARGMGNVQRNYFMADYSMFPNELTRDIFMDDYMLRYEFSGDIVMMDYPRNDAFFDDKMRERIIKEQGLEGKEVFAYMPTWRGGDAHNVSTNSQVGTVAKYLEEIDEKLDDNQVLFVNLHPFVASGLNYEEFRHIRVFPKDYETYDFLNVSDALITDYSSVMFDYAQTGRKVLLFTYDLEEYLRDRGVYLDVKELPFELCRSVDDLLDALKKGKKDDIEEFRRTYCNYRSSDGAGCAESFLRLVVGNAKESEEAFYKIEKPERDENKHIHLYAVADLSGGLSEELRNNIEKQINEGRHVVIAFQGGMKESYIEAFNELNNYEDVEYYSLIGGIRDEDIPREVRRVFPGWRVDSFNTIDKLRRTTFRLVHHLMPVKAYSIKESADAITVRFRQSRLSYLDHASICEHRYELERSGDNYSITIPKDDLRSFKYRNQINLIDVFGNENKIIASRKLSKVLKIIHTKLINVKLGNDPMACYLQEYINRTDLVVRDANYTDKAGQRIIIGAAYILAKLTPGKASLPIILYEKNAERYEESASVLYERLMDKGYKNAYYVLRSGSPAEQSVPASYRSNILKKYSFSHYYKLFRTKTIIATETITHNIDLRPISPFLRYWLKHAGLNYVFLQHGVMYMISLDAETRAFFKLEERPGYVNRIVVSSKLEAEHFIYRGGVKPEELYICGLLKFDRAERYDVHDRIVIMPTWRPWEAVLAAESFRETGYYRFVEKIYNAVPDELKDKVVVLPHPLIKKYAVEEYEKTAGSSNPDGGIIKLMLPDETHEEVLRKTDTLITDYSSIAYDAFYRGANVIFDWEEKDYTVSQYGKTARLMLTEDLAFGNVCYSMEELKEAIKKTYGKGHSKEEEERFGKLVEFHDGRNTERLIEMIKKDGLI